MDLSNFTDEELLNVVNDAFKEIDDRGDQWTHVYWTDNEGWRLRYV